MGRRRERHESAGRSMSVVGTVGIRESSGQHHIPGMFARDLTKSLTMEAKRYLGGRTQISSDQRKYWGTWDPNENDS